MIRIALQDENGVEIDSPIDFPTQMISYVNDDRFKCLRFIDPYGDTIFNNLQMEQLSEDLSLLEISGANLLDVGAICAFRQLISKCCKEPHLYIKCIGD